MDLDEELCAILANPTEPVIWNPHFFVRAYCFKCFVCEQHMGAPGGVKRHVRSKRHVENRDSWSKDKIRSQKELHLQDFPCPIRQSSQPEPNPGDKAADANSGSFLQNAGTAANVSPPFESQRVPSDFRGPPLILRVPSSLYEHVVLIVGIYGSLNAIHKLGWDMAPLHAWLLKMAKTRTAEKREKEATNRDMCRHLFALQKAVTSAVPLLRGAEPPSSALSWKLAKMEEAIAAVEGFLDLAAAARDAENEVKPSPDIVVIDLLDD